MFAAISLPCSLQSCSQCKLTIHRLVSRKKPAQSFQSTEGLMRCSTTTNAMHRVRGFLPSLRSASGAASAAPCLVSSPSSSSSQAWRMLPAGMPRPAQHALPGFLKDSSDNNAGGSSIRGLSCSSTGINNTNTRCRRGSSVAPALSVDKRAVTPVSSCMLQQRSLRPRQGAGVCHAAQSNNGEGGSQKESGGGKGVVSGVGTSCVTITLP